MLLCGTHGDGGVTGLTSREALDREMYETECQCEELLASSSHKQLCVIFLDVGVEPHDVTEDMPDIMEIRKKESPGENSFYNDPDINQMSIQVRRS